MNGEFSAPRAQRRAECSISPICTMTGPLIGKQPPQGKDGTSRSQTQFGQGCSRSTLITLLRRFAIPISLTCPTSRSQRLISVVACTSGLHNALGRCFADANDRENRFRQGLRDQVDGWRKMREWGRVDILTITARKSHRPTTPRTLRLIPRRK